MARLCHLVLLSVAVAGCFDMHGRPGERDAGLRDGGMAVRDASSRDVMSIDDAGEPRCPLLRADATCLESFALPAGVPFELPFEFDGCGCCVETECEVSVNAAERTLSLATHLCPDPCDCDACNVPRGTCSVPPLPLGSVGEWTVEVNGTAAFVIGVTDSLDPDVAPPPGCATYAEIDDCGGARPDFTTGPLRGACVLHGFATNGREVLRLGDDCWGCGEIDSACDVVVTPRLTDDLPPGADITLHARNYFTSCDVDCPGVCLEHTRECALPELTPGDFYRVFVDGEVVSSFIGGDTEPSGCP